MVVRPAPVVPRSRLSPPRVGGLPRARVTALLGAHRTAGLVLVGGPAGTGKTSAVAHWAATSVVPVVWYRAAASGPGPAAVLDHLAGALDVALGPDDDVGPVAGPVHVGHLVARLDRAGGDVVVVVDDVHLLAAADRARLEEFALDATPLVRLVLVGRELPDWHLARGEIAEPAVVDEHDLRYRSWEVETLFRECHGVVLGPAEAVDLTRRTGGWAAGLALLHGDLRRRRPDAVAPTLDSLTERARYASSYLDTQVLAGVGPEDREFLRRTSPFDVLTVARCNALLGGSDAAATLQRLRGVPLLLTADDPRERFRVHPVVRRHLATELADRLGADAIRAWHRRAADCLGPEDDLLERLVARCRAGDEDGVRALLEHHGPALATSRTAVWVGLLSDEFVDTDPWAGLARAVALLEDGRFAAATRAGRSARARSGDPRCRTACDQVVRRAGVWTTGGTDTPARWEDLLRAATTRDPAGTAARARSLPGPMGRLAEGVAWALTGDLERAAVALHRCATDPSSDVVARLSAQLVLTVVAVLGDGAELPAPVLDGPLVEAQELGLSWFVRIARAVTLVRDTSSSDPDLAAVLVERCDADGDRWGAALVAVGSVLAVLRAGDCDVAAGHAAAERFRALDAGVLEAWTRALLAVVVVRSGHPDAVRDARHAETLARTVSAPGALSLARTALAAAGPDRAGYARSAAATARDAGLEPRSWTWLQAARVQGTSASTTARPDPTPAAGRPRVAGSVSAPNGVHPPVVPALAPTRWTGVPRVQVRVFGGFGLALDGRPVDLAGVRPRARAVLRVLCLHAGRPVHRELLAEVFWPDLPVSAALHNLHVAVSSLRGALEPDVAPRASRLLVRDGHAYTLVMAPGANSDLRDFDAAVRAAAAARSIGDTDAEAAALQTATDVFAGDVLPEDGPAEWVVQVREDHRLRAAESAYALASIHLRGGQPAAAARAATQAVRIDRWHDGAWRVLVEALERTGDRAAAGRARAAYADVLAGLGVG